MNKEFTVDIPVDLQKFSRKKLVRRFSLLVLVYAAEVLLFAIFHDYFKSANYCYVVLNVLGMVVLPLAVIILPLKKDVTWVGEIYSFKQKEVAAYTSKVAHPISYIGEKDRIYLTLRNGNDYFDREYDCYPGTKDPPADTYCRSGSIAVHVFGTKYPTVLPDSSDDKSVCVVCGLINSANFDKCDRCGYTLIKRLADK